MKLFALFPILFVLFSTALGVAIPQGGQVQAYDRDNFGEFAIINNPSRTDANCLLFPNDDHCRTVPKAEAPIVNVVAEMQCNTTISSPLNLWVKRAADLLNDRGDSICNSPDALRCSNKAESHFAKVDFCREPNLPKDKEGEGYACKALGYFVHQVAKFCYGDYHEAVREPIRSPIHRVSGQVSFKKAPFGKVLVYRKGTPYF